MLKQKLAGLAADRYPPEKAKFRPPLVLVHGIWAGSWCWETWATHFANLGWDCFAIDLRGEAAHSSDLKNFDLLQAIHNLRAALRELPFPPVIVAMNVGALATLSATRTGGASALVLVSPVPPRNSGIPPSRASRLLRIKYGFLILLRRSIHIEQADFDRYLGNALPLDKRVSTHARTVAESPELVRELFGPRLEFDRAAPGTPTLVLAGGADRLQPEANGRELANWLGADFKGYPGQCHWLIEHDSERIVRDVHRWLILALGEPIMLLQPR